MKKEKGFLGQLPSVLLGLVVIAALAFMAIIVIQYIGGLIVKGVEELSQIASKTDAVIIVALITGAVSILGVVVSSIIAKTVEYRQQTKRYLFEKREAPYSDFVGMVYKLMSSTKSGKKYNEADMFTDMTKFSEQLTLWGSSRVVKKWLKFRTSSQIQGVDPKQNLLVLEDIIFEIRRDMGQKKNGLKQGDLLKFFINDVDALLPRKKGT